MLGRYSRPLMTMPWINLAAAQRRLAQIDVETRKLEAERALIQTILETTTNETRPSSPPPQIVREGRSLVRASTVRVSPARASSARSVGLSLVDLIAEALRFAPPAGLTVVDIVRHVARRHPERPSAPSANLLVSAAAAQACRAKKPRIRIVQQSGRDGPVRYGAA
jgi:hypothetical protein